MYVLEGEGVEEVDVEFCAEKLEVVEGGLVPVDVGAAWKLG